MYTKNKLTGILKVTICTLMIIAATICATPIAVAGQKVTLGPTSTVISGSPTVGPTSTTNNGSTEVLVTEKNPFRLQDLLPSFKATSKFRDGGALTFIAPAAGHYAATWEKSGQTKTWDMGQVPQLAAIAQQFGEDRSDYLLSIESADANFRLQFQPSPGWDIAWKGVTITAPFDLSQIEITSENGGWLRQDYAYSQGETVVINVPFVCEYPVRDACVIKLIGANEQWLSFPYAYFGANAAQTVIANSHAGQTNWSYYVFDHIYALNAGPEQKDWHYAGQAFTLDKMVEWTQKYQDIENTNLYPPNDYLRANAGEWAWGAISLFTSYEYSWEISLHRTRNIWQDLNVNNQPDWWTKPATRWESAVIICPVIGADFWACNDYRLEFQQTQQFSDVPPSQPYARYVNDMKFLGMASGRGDGTFDPEALITREEAAKLIFLYVTGRRSLDPQVLEKWCGTWDLPCSDFDQVSSWAKPYIAALYFLGVITGNPDGTFAPQRLVSRQEMAVMMARAELNTNGTFLLSYGI